MATIQERITLIETSLASGVTTTTIDGQSVTRSLAEMRKELTRLRGLQAAGSGGTGAGIPGLQMFATVQSNGRGE